MAKEYYLRMNAQPVSNAADAASTPKLLGPGKSASASATAAKTSTALSQSAESPRATTAVKGDKKVFYDDREVYGM